MKNAQYWIEKLNLQQHPEGGFYAETYRSKDRLHESKLPDRYKSPRVFGTSIYFLLTTESVSNFHRLNSDEIWHFHTGGVAKIHFIDKQGAHSEHLIGSDLERDQRLQVVIPKDTWFAAEVVDGDYILVGCTVAPGFEFEDFELADRTELSSAYPQHQTLIGCFTNN
ncbi:cupin domain-containing protein [Roseivirga spongicola]|uniref:cupin domain-containing protein n=1 Tax=Roseivirga spongicola TaxID=333140 RepID=UPI002AC93DD3|nr:cupin domain-containing protein [Roseivirga spongicola]WPZ12015.1 cupin domain-containing protein [Roseivirga spongicola]